MYIIRQIETRDLETLYELSKIVYFINLPSDKEIIEKRIIRSIDTFQASNKPKENCLYIFILEDTSQGKALGVSMIHAQHGTEDEPHFYLKVGKEEKFSQSINTGFVHGTLKLGMDTDGPTEIGGLVLHPDMRKNGFKLGKQLSYSRFLFMAMNRKKFKDKVISELMPPLDSEGNSPLWEAIGRRFMNMGYQDADRLSRSNKDFILSLYPSENIYQTLLPLEARNAIGRVGKDTQPVKKMLSTIGFEYVNEVDPFDGGPHYHAMTDEILPIKSYVKGEAVLAEVDENFTDYLISLERDDNKFVCFRTLAKIENGKCLIDRSISDDIEYKIGSIAHMVEF
jgi:arginine N-succinyltransferase